MGYASAMAVLLLVVAFALTRPDHPRLAAAACTTRGRRDEHRRRSAREPAPQRAVRRPARRSAGGGCSISIADHSLLIVAAIAFLAPVVFIVLTSLMTNDQALSSQLWPDPFRWRNYVDVFSSAPLWRWALNSFIYASLATIGLLRLEHPCRVRVRAPALARSRRDVPRRPRRPDAAAAGHGRAAVRDVGEARTSSARCGR